jgi:hypothetical protein
MRRFLSTLFRLREGRAAGLVTASDADGESSQASGYFIAEYTALREEVQYRSQAQHTIINIALTANAAIAGLVLSGRGQPLLLLLIPPLCFALGNLYLDHARCTRRIGQYIEEELSKAAAQAGKNSMVFHWEASIRNDRQTVLRRIVFTLPIFLVFVGSGLVAICFSFTTAFRPSSVHNLIDWWPRAVWIIEVASIAFLTLLWLVITPTIVTRNPRKHRRQEPYF